MATVTITADDAYPQGFVRRFLSIVEDALVQIDPEWVDESSAFDATFGVQYSREVHPTLGFINPDSSIRVEGLTEPGARAVIHTLADGQWAFLYADGTLRRQHHPIDPVIIIRVTT